MIEGYIGRPGSGKSYTLTARTLEAAKQGRQCFTNFGLKHPNVERITIEDLTDPQMPAGLVVIDEAHLWFDARLSMKLPPSLLMRMSQTRKMGWDLLWCTQDEGNVDKRIKVVTNWMWLCGAWGGWNGHPIAFTSMCYEPRSFRKKGQHHQRAIRYFDKEVAESYDTLESLQVASHVAALEDAYKRGANNEAGAVRGGRGSRRRVVAEPASSGRSEPVERVSGPGAAAGLELAPWPPSWDEPVGNGSRDRGRHGNG